jgi:DinB family protein
MSTAQAGVAVSDPEAYRERLFGLVGEQNPLRVMAQTGSALEEIVRMHTAAVLCARPFEGKWSAKEIIGHLGDGEWVYGFRLRLIFCEKDPGIVGTAQEVWVARQKHNERDAAELVEVFRMLRELNLAFWQGVSPEDLKRVGSHNERGRETLEVMLRMVAGHDLSHLEQIRRYIRVAMEQGG